MYYWGYFWCWSRVLGVWFDFVGVGVCCCGIVEVWLLVYWFVD